MEEKFTDFVESLLKSIDSENIVIKIKKGTELYKFLKSIFRNNHMMHKNYYVTSYGKVEIKFE